MSRKHRRAIPHTLDDFMELIIKELEVVVAISGWRRGDVYDDWLEAIYYTLRAEPDHELAWAAHEPLPTPPEDEAKAFARFRQRYGTHWEETHTKFAHALNWARMATTMGLIDVLGPLFEQWGAVNVDAGQFFTPPDVAKLLAHLLDENEPRPTLLSSPDGTPEDGLASMLAQHIEAAITARPPAALMAFFGQAFRATERTRSQLVDAAARLLELDRGFARRLDTACAESTEAFMILTLGESQGRRPDEGAVPLHHSAASLVNAQDPLGRDLRQLVRLSPSAQILHLWIWTLRTDDHARQHWLLAAIARIIDADTALAERLGMAIAQAPDLSGIAPGHWRLDTVSPPERQWMTAQVIFRAYDAFTAVSCYDPASGACTLLLHMAELLTEQGYRYAIDLNLVTFWGQDKDHRVWMLGSTNVMLHGMNGHRLKVARARVLGTVRLLQRGRAALLDGLAPDVDEEQISAVARQLCQIDASIRNYEQGELPDGPIYIATEAHARAVAEVRRTIADFDTVITLEQHPRLEAAA